MYVLGVGACGADTIDDKELHLVHHTDDQHHVKIPPRPWSDPLWFLCELVAVSCHGPIASIRQL